MLHIHLQTNCSSLNQDRFHKNISDTTHCTCGSMEYADHFLLACPLYYEQRQELFWIISLICPISVNVLLFGNSNVSYKNNITIFEAVLFVCVEVLQPSQPHGVISSVIS